MNLGDRMNLHELIKSKQHKDRVVIAIDGPSGSGKSTLSAVLEEKYDALVIHVDDYFLPKEMKTEERLNEIGGNFHYERFIEEVINNIDKEVIPYNKFNCMNETITNNEVKSKPIIVIEGCYSLHILLRDFYDIKVFTNVDRDTQLKRIEKRSGKTMLQRFIKEWIPLENQYFKGQNVMGVADLIIEN